MILWEKSEAILTNTLIWWPVAIPIILGVILLVLMSAQI